MFLDEVMAQPTERAPSQDVYPESSRALPSLTDDQKGLLKFAWKIVKPYVWRWIDKHADQTIHAGPLGDVRIGDLTELFESMFGGR